jgi:lipid-A-disaccharide synthase
MPPSVLFVAGDPSGDEHASAVIRRLSSLLPGVRTFGIGGPRMAQAGFEQLLPFEPFNRMGLVEVVRHLPFFLKAKSNLVKVMAERRPSVLVCVDYPGFNIPLMKAAKKLGVPVVWYIAPQVWAWKKNRAETLGRNASYIAVVFPFEEPYFNSYPAPVSFVGHPLVEALAQTEASVLRDASGFDATGPIRCALVPGSREQEIRYLLKPMVDACILLKRKHPQFYVVVSKCPGLSNAMFEQEHARFSAQFPGAMTISEDPLVSVLSQSDLAVVTSGTATLQTALLGIPMVIAYRTSMLTYSLLKSMVTLPYIGLPNIVAGEKIVPELIQRGATAHAIADEVSRYLESVDLYTATKGKLTALRERLGTKTPSVEVARAIVSLAEKGA